MVRTYEDNEKWPEYIQEVNDNLNDTYHRVIKTTPRKLHESEVFDERGTKRSEPVKKARENMMKEANKRTWLEHKKFDKGDIVRIKQVDGDDYNWSRDVYVVVKSKQARKITGRTTYQVKKAHKLKGSNRYIAADRKGEPIPKRYYNTDLLLIPQGEVKHFVKEPVKMKLSKIYSPVFDEDSKEKFLLVKFTRIKAPQLEPYENIKKDAPKLVAAFEKNSKSNGVKMDLHGAGNLHINLSVKSS